MKKPVFVFLLIFQFFYALGQKKYNYIENTKVLTISTNAGLATLFGEIGDGEALLGTNDWNIIKRNYLLSLNFRCLFSNNLGLKLGVHKGNFEGSDVGTSRNERGFSFRSETQEISLSGEYILLGGPFTEYETPHTIYVYGGAGFLKNKVNSFTTTGLSYDKLKLSVTTPTMPLGLGYLYSLNKQLAVGMEFGWHITFNDYLEGVAMPYSRNNDIIAYLNFTLQYTIKK
jgi:hypothetical protein